MKWEENVRKVVPYVPGEQPKNKNVVKLNTNECPYPPSPLVREALKHFPYEELRLYPDVQATELVEELANTYQIKKENIFVGVGSDDVLAMAFLTFFNSKKPILFPDITYSFYDVWAELYRIPYICKPLDDNFKIKRIVYSTYQAVSGSGLGGLKDLEEGNVEFYPYNIQYNTLPQVDSFLENGYTKEEMKMIEETQKILNNYDLKVTATTVRVPVFNSHSESINVELEKKLTEVLEKSGSLGKQKIDDDLMDEIPLNCGELAEVTLTIYSKKSRE